jgi:hypothetical protein
MSNVTPTSSWTCCKTGCSHEGNGRDQKRTLFTLPELVVFGGVVVAALAGLFALISGRISI